MEKLNFNKEQNSVEDFTENKSESAEDGGGKEIIKKDAEAQKSIEEQKELIKEKYDQEIFIGEGFSLEELQNFKDALKEIKTFSPDKFNELKIILVKADTDLFSMKAILNFCEKFDTI